MLRCNGEGCVEQILHEDPSLQTGVRPGQPFTTMVCPGNLAKALDFFAALRRDGHAFDWEINTGGAAAGVQTLRFSGAPLADGFVVVAVPDRHDLDPLIGAMLSINNEAVTELHRLYKDRIAQGADEFLDGVSQINNELATAQRELAKANVQLRAAIEAKERLIGMLVHDLRTPLGVIGGYAEFLEGRPGGRIDPAERNIIGQIRNASRYMSALIDNTLAQSAIQSGSLVLDLRPTDLAGIVRQVADTNAFLVAGKNIRIIADLPGEPLHIAVDAIRIEQVINNIISNAIKYSHESTVVVVAVTADAGGAVISVRDRGIGIAPEVMARLFQPYARGAGGGISGEPSYGLGLYICHRIVTAHGGSMTVDSVVGEGTTVRVHLPTAAASIR